MRKLNCIVYIEKRKAIFPQENRLRSLMFLKSNLAIAERIIGLQLKPS